MLVPPHFVRLPTGPILVYACPSNPCNNPLISFPTYQTKYLYFFPTFSHTFITPNPKVLLSISPPNLASPTSLFTTFLYSKNPVSPNLSFSYYQPRVSSFLSYMLYKCRLCSPFSLIPIYHLDSCVHAYSLTPDTRAKTDKERCSL
jgi:hypothetical protein